MEKVVMIKRRIKKKTFSIGHVRYINSNMAPRLPEQTSIFGVVFFVSKSLLGIERQKKPKICNFDPKASDPC